MTSRIILAMFLLCGSFSYGKEVRNHAPGRDPLDQIKAETSEVDEARVLAEKGEPEAQTQMGDRYRNGSGVVKDPVAALEWYRKAADQGFAKAQVQLGQIYAKGDGVSRDFSVAAEWYRKAAQQGHPFAQGELGLMHMKGTGVEKDDVEAYKWFYLTQNEGMSMSAYWASKSILTRMTAEQVREAESRAKAFVPGKAAPEKNVSKETSSSEEPTESSSSPLGDP